MATITEMAKEIVAAHASTTTMTKDELLKELSEVHAVLSALEKGEAPLSAGPAESIVSEEGTAPAVSLRKAFGKNQVMCMICGKGMKTLARHLRTAHDMKPSEYRKQFGIPRTQPLAAKAYSESRRQMAVDRGLGENLAKARAAKAKKSVK
jgi:predicted transcriptional regulator